MSQHNNSKSPQIVFGSHPSQRWPAVSVPVWLQRSADRGRYNNKGFISEEIHKNTHLKWWILSRTERWISVSEEKFCRSSVEVKVCLSGDFVLHRLRVLLDLWLLLWQQITFTDETNKTDIKREREICPDKGGRVRSTEGEQMNQFIH